MKIFWLFLVFSFCLIEADQWIPEKMPFPENFLFGVSTAAFQTEGATKEDGKGESIWDRYTTDLDFKDGTTAADSYHNLEMDVNLLRQLGVDFYKFSISWPRVMPTGFPNKINEDGIKYYNDLLNELTKYNIEPMVVMHHHDLPQPLQELGGWANPESVKWFFDYSDVLLDKFNGKVKYWITINDPVTFCYDGYNGKTQPGLNSKGIGDYKCIKNMLVAHGKVYRHFERNFKKKSGNQMGFAMTLNTYIPKDHDTKHEMNRKATNDIHQFAYHIFLHPIYGENGDFPMELKDIILKNSLAGNFTRSRLPSLSKEEIRMLKGASDFLGMNHETSYEVTASNKPIDKFPDVTGQIGQKAAWQKSVNKEIKMYPYGLYYMWFILHKAYRPMDIFVTEFGWPTGPGLEDKEQVNVLTEYLKSLLYMLQDAGPRIKGFAVRSLLDGAESPVGNGERYGLFEVDFNSGNKTRSVRSSAKFYRHVIESRLVQDDWVHKNLKLDFSTRRTKKSPATHKDEL